MTAGCRSGPALWPNPFGTDHFERGRATPKEFHADVCPEHTGRYTEGDDPAYSWWTNCIYKDVRELAERTDAVEKADTTDEWAWRGEA